MKTTLGSNPSVLRFHALRFATLAAAFLSVALGASAKDTTDADPANALLARHGHLAVKSVGPYVEVGTFRIQVAAKLGQPTAKVSDDTWLYGNFNAEQSEARGTLVVRFMQGRVSELTLVTPAVATAMMNPATPAKSLVAARR